MLLWKKLKKLNRNLGKMRARESRLLEEICLSDDYDEVKEKLESIINCFYTLLSLEEQTKDLSFLGWMIYEFRFRSVYGEAWDIKYNAENVLYDMEQQGESNFDLENILSTYFEGLNDRKKDAIKFIIIFILGALCLAVPFIGVISNLIVNLCGLVLGTILTYKSLSYIRLSAIKSINNNEKMLTDKIIDIQLEKKLMAQTYSDTLSNENRKLPSRELPYSFKGESIKERTERGQVPMKKREKPGKIIEK